MGVRIARLLMVVVILINCSCSSNGLVRLAELLNDSAPVYTLSGGVYYISQMGHLPAAVRLEASIPEDDEMMVWSDQIGGMGGDYSIEFKWHSEVNYTLRVVNSEDSEIYYEELGKIGNHDFTQDITMP